MKTIIFYTLNGKYESIEPLTESNVNKICGSKVKVITTDGKEHVGYLENFYKVYDYVNLYTYKFLDEKSGKLIALEGQNKYELIREKIYVKDMVHVDAIRYSNPRWGTPLTNKFKFF